jgi:Fe-S oxidoreductase/nitrate reductase gamma subunit
LNETRTVFADLSRWEVTLWYLLAFISTAIFVAAVSRLVWKYRRGRGSQGLRPTPVGLVRAIRAILSHSGIRRRSSLGGIGHLGIFYGFVVLFIGTVILAVQIDFTEPLFSFSFWYGWFYLTYSLILDLAGVALIVGVSVMIVRRVLVRPSRLDYQRVDSVSGYDRRRYTWGDWYLLVALLFLALTGYLLEAFRIAESNPSFEVWSPVGWLLAQGLRMGGLNDGAAQVAHHVLWWVHGAAALIFVSSVPFTKAVHMLTSPASLSLRDDKAASRLLRQPADVPAHQVGYALVTDISPKFLLQVDACTKCGKCHEVCPATNSGYPLSPRDLVLDLREQAEGTLGLRALLRIPPRFSVDQTLTLRPETIWSCMQCMACMVVCPVGIEHVPLINQVRRRLVEQGEMDPKLQSTLEAIHVSGNSFGEGRRKRARWTSSLEFKVKDIRTEPAEYLWFVGDYASFDPRNQQATQALARVLHTAGVDFGILYDGERNAGCDVRRAGEEGLFASLAQQNIETISSCHFDTLITSDPHSYTTLKNEYPELGGEWRVLHHSELLHELIGKGRILPARQLGVKVTYHDPCMLGRYNGVYDAPRRVLEAIGAQLHEMPRNRDNSFCCGAGGGRIWMTELRDLSKPRPSEMRIEEAVSLGKLDYFVVSCPKDVTMYEDAVKTSGHQSDIQVKELAELVLQSLDLPTAPQG